MLKACDKKMEWVLSSDAGDCRPENEDRLFASSVKCTWRKSALFAVADGCGGMQRGAEASAAAINCVNLFWKTRISRMVCRPWIRSVSIDTCLEEMMQTAHADVCALAEKNQPRPASTLTVFLVAGKQFWIRHVGDCRIYRLSDYGTDLERLTEDQSMVADMLRNREIEPWEATDYSRSVLSMCLGMPTKLHTYAQSGTIHRGDIFLLCSDGLYAYADEKQIAAQLANDPSDDRALRNLICPGQAGDNVSFITVWEE